MQHQQLSQAEQNIAELRAEIERLKQMLAQVLSTAGGAVDGQIDLGDLLQFATIERPGTPRAGAVKVYALDNGHLYALDENGVERDLAIIDLGELLSPANPNDAIVSGDGESWDLASGPDEEGEIRIAGSDPYTPAWSRTLPATIMFQQGLQAEDGAWVGRSETGGRFAFSSVPDSGEVGAVYWSSHIRSQGHVDQRSGWRLRSDGRAQLTNAIVRGELRSVHLAADEAHAVAGTLYIAPAATLYETVTIN